MKKLLTLTLVLLTFCLFPSCAKQGNNTDILTTTAPLYEFATLLCNNTNLNVDCLITESVSCLHDYTLQTRQLRALEEAQIVIISGCGLEESFADFLDKAKDTLDASNGVSLICSNHTHTHDDYDHDHDHEDAYDPHIWLSIENAQIMANNIYIMLCERYPAYLETFQTNYTDLTVKFNELKSHAEKELTELKSKKLITFHDGFSYMADSFGLEILHAIEEESGREASAAELIHLCEIVTEHQIPCIFTESNGSTSAAQIISDETGVPIYQLDMAMSKQGYFSAMYHNIATLKEALG